MDMRIWLSIAVLVAGFGCGGDKGNPGSGDGGVDGGRAPSTGGNRTDAAMDGGTGAGTGGDTGAGTGGSDVVPIPRATETIGPDGGTVSSGDATLDIPSGALSEPTEITIRTVDAPVALPDGYEVVSAVYEATPHGQQFDEPVVMSLPHTAGAGFDLVVLRLSSPDAAAWTELGGASIDAAAAHFEVTTFSYFVVAARCKNVAMDCQWVESPGVGGTDAGTTSDPDAGTTPTGYTDVNLNDKVINDPVGIALNDGSPVGSVAEPANDQDRAAYVIQIAGDFNFPIGTMVMLNFERLSPPIHPLIDIAVAGIPKGGTEADAVVLLLLSPHWDANGEWAYQGALVGSGDFRRLDIFAGGNLIPTEYSSSAQITQFRNARTVTVPNEFGLAGLTNLAYKLPAP